MKIVQVNVTCTAGSTGKICRAIGERLVARGDKSYILHVQALADTENHIAYATPSYIRAQALRSRLLGNYGFNSRAATKRLIAHLERIKPDVIHLHSSKAGILGRLAFPSKKVIYTVHGFDTVRLANRRFLFLEKIMQRFCRSIVAVSEYDRRNLLAENINRNVTTVYNGTASIAVAGDLSFGIPAKYKKTVLCIARVSYPKNSVLFMEVAKLLPQYAFVWIGNKEPMHDTPENVFFLGNIPNAAMYCSLADVFMLPSEYEGLPIVIIEAMSFGKPVVASNVGGVSELVRNGVNGYALENNANVFAEKISHILENQQVYGKMSQSSTELYDSYFTVDKMVGGYKDVYNSLLGKESF